MKQKVKKWIPVTLATTLLLGNCLSVNAAPSEATKQNLDQLMKVNEAGVPNWFQGDYYSNKYEDLKIAFGENTHSLYKHSLRYGFQEARIVTPILDVAKYRKAYPDLDKAFGDNWELYIRHYLEFGIAEGRKNFTEFDARTYLSLNVDLRNAFGEDLILAIKHYLENGIKENREYKKPVPVVITPMVEDTTEDRYVPFTGIKVVDLGNGNYYEYSYVEDVLVSSIEYKDGKKNNYREYNEKGLVVYRLRYHTDGVNQKFKCYYTYDENNLLKTEEQFNVNPQLEPALALYWYREYQNGLEIVNKSRYNDGSTGEVYYIIEDNESKRILESETKADGTRVTKIYYKDGYAQYITYGADGNVSQEKWEAKDANGDSISLDATPSPLPERVGYLDWEEQPAEVEETELIEEPAMLFMVRPTSTEEPQEEINGEEAEGDTSEEKDLEEENPPSEEGNNPKEEQKNTEEEPETEEKESLDETPITE